MNKIATAATLALMLGTAPLALSTSALAQDVTVDVTFTGSLATELGLDEGAVIQLPLSLAAEVCDVSEADLTTDPSCDAVISTDDLEDFLDDDDDNNSAKEFAPGQLKEDGESAKEFAPGQVKEDGESAKESAPGQQKKSDD